MGLESFSYITSLNSSNPVHATDPVSQGDDHIRGVKTTLLNSFPNIDAAVTFTPTEANRLTGLTGLTGTGNLVASISPTLTGTLTAAIANFSGAITALSYGGITEANLVDKSAAETIAGAWGFAAITATSYDGIAAANLVDKSAAETIAGQWVFSLGPQLADIELGHASDTTITRSAAGKVEVEGKPMIAHNDGALGSGEIYVSTSAPSGGSDGDIWLEREV
jgi:hypothetical protein